MNCALLLSGGYNRSLDEFLRIFDNVVNAVASAAVIKVSKLVFVKVTLPDLSSEVNMPADTLHRGFKGE